MAADAVPMLAGLPFAAMLGVWCAQLAAVYARRVDGGAPVDGTTLRQAARLALRAGLRWVAGRRPLPVSPVLAGSCAVLLGLAFLPFALQPSLLSGARFAACAALLALALIDARCRLLPDALTLPLLWAGLLVAWAGRGVSLHDAVAAAATAYVLLRGLAAVFEACRGRAGMGGGDVKLVAALGAWLGWAPLPGVLLAACIAGVLFALRGHGLKAWGASLAFGPFLAVCGALGLVGSPVVQLLF